MRQTKILCFVFLLILLPIFVSAQKGCCTNPGSGLLYCTSERLAEISECCPTPVSSNPAYYDANSNGPSNFNDCEANFFSPGQSCSSIGSCQLGCCCQALSGEVTTQLLCSGSFFPGEFNCVSACNIPECSDGINNDPSNNNCADFPSDTGCTSSSDITESGGSCVPISGNSCNNVNYIPRILDFTSTPIKGQKKVILEWTNECASNLVSTDIMRCEGTNCNMFETIGTSTQNSFTDEDPQIKFGKTYTYGIASSYSIQAAKPFATSTASLGDLECWNQFTGNNFCVHEQYYDQYKGYLVNLGFSEQNFEENVKAEFSGKLNRAFSCDSSNLLSEKISCDSLQVCIVSNNNPSCVEISTCNPDETNSFGLFFTEQACEGTDTDRNYCFLDRSLSSVDSCFRCSPTMSCYDYKSQDSCARDNCGAGNCDWRPLSEELGTGVCVDLDSDNCKWCDSAGTGGLESTTSTNSIFEQCTQEKSNLLSVDEFMCYFNGQKSSGCSEITCNDYQPQECSSVNIQLNEFNIPVNPSSDRCGFSVCQNFNGVCMKNADGDSVPDCGDESCEQDLFAPNTTLVPVIERGIYRSLLIEVSDKTHSLDPNTKRSSEGYKTYLCKESCAETHPYSRFSSGYSLIVSDLKVFDGDVNGNGDLLLNLDEGPNIIRYYSEDPSKNIGEVNTINVIASSDLTGPKVFRLGITNVRLVENVYYTNSTRPAFSIEFFENAAITSAKVTKKDTQVEIVPEFSNNLQKQHSLNFLRDLPEGDYLFELNAKDRNGVLMDIPFAADVVIDLTPPEISVEPVSEALITESSEVPITISSEEPITLKQVMINRENHSLNFISEDGRTYTSTITLQDGNKQMEIHAEDLAGNPVSLSSGFVLNAQPLAIALKAPSFGVSPVYTFDLIAETDNDANCRYSLDSPLEFTFMGKFDSSGLEHKVEAFNEIPVGSTSIHKLYIACNDNINPQKTEIFDLSVDTENPQIKTAFAFPDPIVEIPRTTTMKIEANRETICKYSPTSNNFNLMENTFLGFENNSFSTVNTREITVNADGPYAFFVACMSKAELVSDSQQITFISDTTLPITITSFTPEFSGTEGITLAVETNKKAQCKFSDNILTLGQGTIFGPSSYSHTKDILLVNGRYGYYVTCIDQFLQQWSAPKKVVFTIDTNPPAMLFVNDTSTLIQFPEFTCNTDRLRAKWLGEDLESGVQQYTYSIQKGNDVIVNPTSTAWGSSPGDEWVWITNLDLQETAKYVFKVFATDFLNHQSEPLSSNGITVDPAVCAPEPFCGDGNLDLGELCDPDDGTMVFGPIDSCTDYSNFIGGVLGCSSSNCVPDTSACTLQPFCGDRIIQKGEHCDGSLFGKVDTCADLGFSGGSIRCEANCFLDTIQCRPSPTCGNGIIDQGEECDGNLGILNGQCTQYAPNFFTGGSLSCNNCKIDTSSCFGAAGTCDGNFINPGEKCDGKVFGVIDTCSELGFDGGTLNCKNCQLDTNACASRATCGNSLIDPGEECDGNNLGTLTTNRCTEFSSYFESGTIACGSNCKLNTFSCVEAALCGNGIVDGNEQCDSDNFGNLDGTCSEFSQSFLGGLLECGNDCKIDTSACVSSEFCGNEKLEIENGETCEGSDFGSFGGSCTDFNSDSFVGGSLSCKACGINTENCQEIPSCGNGAIDSGETCDGSNFGNLDGTCAQFSSSFNGGSLRCTSCQIDTSSCQGSAGVCGDNSINTGETCDGIFGRIRQCSQIPDFSGGNLACSNCQLDTSACIEVGCGNGFINAGEQCDRTNLGNLQCSDLGYADGILSCDNSCKFDTSSCNLPPECGDGNIDPGEQCDDSGPVFGSKDSCLDFNNFIGGNLGCNNCKLDTTSCTLQPFCGDRIIQKGEHCDGSLFGKVDTCADLGFSGGSIRCEANCFLDTIQCRPSPTCGNGIIDQGEECEVGNLGLESSLCTEYDSLFTGGALSCNNCKLDTSACSGTTGTCGDGFIDIGERCDGNDFGAIADCKDYEDFSGGILSCSSCSLNTNACIPQQKCGNGLIDPGEECDGVNLGSITDSCSEYSSFFSGGKLSCGSDCRLNTFSCDESAKCGNGAIDSGETCDRSNFGNITDLRCASYGNKFKDGQISCSRCEISTSSCTTNTTAINVTCRDRGDCALGQFCTDNSDCLSNFCINSICAGPSCSDNVKNQGESDIDCGKACAACADGKKCSQNSDCASNSCSFGICKQDDSCSNEILSGTESDIDCGGACPNKCRLGQSCNFDSDCRQGNVCASRKCSAPEVGSGALPDQDTDGDGIPDKYEIENGMNPNDPSDADKDFDGDGLTNLQEYTYRTNINSKDTDGDGASDKMEVDKGTDPLDPNSKPKSILLIVLLLLLLIILLSGGGYGSYYYYQNYVAKPKVQPKAFSPRYIQRPVARPKATLKPKTDLLKKEDEKRQKRQALFGTFGSAEAAKKPAPKEAPKTASEPIPKPATKATGETKTDVFSKLKLISKADDKPKPQQGKDVFAKLRQLTTTAEAKAKPKRKTKRRKGRRKSSKKKTHSPKTMETTTIITSTTTKPSKKKTTVSKKKRTTQSAKKVKSSTKTTTTKKVTKKVEK